MPTGTRGRILGGLFNLQFPEKSGVKRKNPERPIGARDNRGSPFLYHQLKQKAAIGARDNRESPPLQLQLEESVQQDPLWIPGARDIPFQSWVESGKIKVGQLICPSIGTPLDMGETGTDARQVFSSGQFRRQGRAWPLPGKALASRVSVALVVSSQRGLHIDGARLDGFSRQEAEIQSCEGTRASSGWLAAGSVPSTRPERRPAQTSRRRTCEDWGKY